MRTLELRLGIALAALAPLSAAFAQQVTVAPVDLPKLIFCSGQCFAIDEKGVRTPVTKGAILREGVRLETGPGAYAQLKVGQAAELAVSERGRVSFDQKSVGGRDLVILDQGRIRMIAGEAMGKIERRALELRTPDGTFALKSADVEVKRLASGAAASNLTYLKVNNGDASLRQGGIQVALSKDAVQGITAGKVIADRTFSLNEVALPPTAGTRPAIGPGSTLTISPAPVAGLPEIRTPLPVTVTVAPTLTTVPIIQTISTTTGACLTCTTTVLTPTTTQLTPVTSTGTSTLTSTTSPLVTAKSTTLSNTFNTVNTTTTIIGTSGSTTAATGITTTQVVSPTLTSGSTLLSTTVAPTTTTSGTTTTAPLVNTTVQTATLVSSPTLTTTTTTTRLTTTRFVF
ncbi:MAG TPA: hypothetical protein VFB01_10565 [Burkholderiales bacterium]|nr:hypothetical protein [Burkholderiales bacterium]